MKVRRLLVYEGSEEWVKRTMSMSLRGGVDGEYKTGPDYSITSTIVPMTAEECREEVLKRRPGTVCATEHAWRHVVGREVNEYSISYNFMTHSCTTKYGNSFEECLAQIDDEDEKVNEEISRMAILLRKFD